MDGHDSIYSGGEQIMDASGWILAGSLMMAAGAGIFAAANILINRWLKSGSRLHE